jgi:hypothetical protein
MMRRVKWTVTAVVLLMFLVVALQNTGTLSSPTTSDGAVGTELMGGTNPMPGGAERYAQAPVTVARLGELHRQIKDWPDC